MTDIEAAKHDSEPETHDTLNRYNIASVSVWLRKREGMIWMSGVCIFSIFMFVMIFIRSRAGGQGAATDSAFFNLLPGAATPASSSSTGLGRMKINGKDDGGNATLTSPQRVMHCSTLHTSSAMDGLNIFKQKLIGYLGEVSCVFEPSRLTVYLPPLQSHSNLLDGIEGQVALLPFEDVFDIQVLNQFMAPIQLLSDSPPLQIFDNQREYSFTESSAGLSVCKRKLNSPEQVPLEIVCSPDIQNRRDGDALRLFLATQGRERLISIMSYLIPAPHIRSVGEAFLKSRPSSSLMCIHLRTEKDFKDFFHGPPRYYSNENYRDKLAVHMAENPEVYKGITSVYISGDHPEDFFTQTIIPLFQPLFQSGEVLGHTSLLPFGFGNFQNIQRAILDQDICARAKVFLGTIQSGWSEITHYTRLAFATQESFGKGGPPFKDILDFQINDSQDSAGLIGTKISKMISANHNIFLGQD